MLVVYSTRLFNSGPFLSHAICRSLWRSQKEEFKVNNNKQNQSNFFFKKRYHLCNHMVATSATSSLQPIPALFLKLLSLLKMKETEDYCLCRDAVKLFEFS